MATWMRIGEVAERVGLSMRTIRYYEEVGLVGPAARTHGGFRLYGELNVERLCMVKRMKALNLELDEMAELLGVLDLLQDGSSATDDELDRLRRFSALAERCCSQLREQLCESEQFAAELRGRLPRAT